jgi:hypothetical protein
MKVLNGGIIVSIGELLTWGEATQIYISAGVSVSTFRRRVNEGVIQGVPGEKARDTRYPKDQVLAALSKEKKRAARKPPSVPDVVLDWLRPEDIPAALILDQIVYHEMFLADAEVYMAWRRKNPKISMAAFDAKDRRVCYGYIGLIPLPEPVILNVLMGKKDEKEVTPDDILTYDEPGEYTLLANSAVIHPDYPELANRIIHAIMQFWIDQYPERRIKRLYAQTVSPQGRNLARKLYLGPLYLTNSDGVLTRVEDAYVLDMQEEAVSKVIRQFQEALHAKEQPGSSPAP